MQIDFTFKDKEYQKIYNDIIKKDIGNQKYLLFVMTIPIAKNIEWEEFLNDEKTSIIVFLSVYIQGYKDNVIKGNRDYLDECLMMAFQMLKNPTALDKYISDLTNEMNKIKNKHIKSKLNILINLLSL